MQRVTPIERISREQLADTLLSDRAHTVAVIDVRGDDHVGGHIHGSTHVPSTSLDYKIPELVRKLSTLEIVVFHCALSQERGPRAARRYMEEREKKIAAGALELGTVDGEDKSKSLGSEGQKIHVLDKGFVGWQEKYVTTSFVILINQFH